MIDFGEVRYLDSSGIRVLYDMARRLERRQQLATVVSQGSPVHVDPRDGRGEELGQALSQLRA